MTEKLPPLKPIFETPPENLCLHVFQPFVDFATKSNYDKCIFCGKVKDDNKLTSA